ncbi:MAG TPA: nucleotide exchange factor GrpE [Methylomirabilota bacterium]|nr:nucleotide exchange factor GrpE [Methylomirabilota bacterium]
MNPKKSRDTRTPGETSAEVSMPDAGSPGATPSPGPAGWAAEAGDPGTAGEDASVPAGTPVSEAVEELKTKAAQADENWQQYLRMAADFENYRKRAARERQEAIKYASEGILQKLMPVIDNLDMAINAAGAPTDSPAASPDSLRTGIMMIFNQLKTVLSESGLEEINAQGQPFDPHWHEAVAQEDSTGIPEGHVIRQVRKGYKLRDRLLRPASVVVARKPTG